MAKVKTRYPRKQDATCIICEDIRVEKSNKLMFMGVYPGGAVNFNKSISQDEPGQVGLTFCIWFHNCVGDVQIDLAIQDPNGETLKTSNIGVKTGEKGKVLTMILPPALFQFPEVGTYGILVTLDKREFEFPLIVTSQE